MNEEPEVNEKQPDERVAAETVTINQGGANTVTAQTVTVVQGGINSATAESIRVEQGGIARAEGVSIQVDTGGIALARGETVTVNRGGAMVVVAETAHMNEAIVGLAIAGEITGDAQILIDAKSAAIIGAIAGLVIGGMKLLWGRRRGG